MTLRLNVSKHISFLLKIGGDIFLTAAHCLENWAGEVQEPSELTVYLGVHNRRDLRNAKYGSFVFSQANVCTSVIILFFNLQKV